VSRQGARPSSPGPGLASGIPHELLDRRFGARGTVVDALLGSEVNREKVTKLPSKDMTVSEAGRRGGQSTRTRYGPQFYQRIGKKGGQATKQRHGADFYELIGRRGGERVKRERGSSFYERIGRKGGQRVRELVEQGKRAGG